MQSETKSDLRRKARLHPETDEAETPPAPQPSLRQGYILLGCFFGSILALLLFQAYWF